MSVKYLPRQLPNDHIVQRRFNPYKKANFIIRHMEKAKLSPRVLDQPEVELPHIEIKKIQCFEDSKGVNLSPMSKLSFEVQQKIDAINSFNNLSCCKPLKHKRCYKASTPKEANKKFKIKLEKKNYYELIQKAFNETGKCSIKECVAVDREAVARIRKSPNSKSLEKMRSSRAIESFEITKTEFTTFDNFLNYEKQLKSRSMSRKVRSHKQSRIVDFARDQSMKRMKQLREKKSSDIDLTDVMSISPITDTNKCIGFK